MSVHPISCHADESQDGVAKCTISRRRILAGSTAAAAAFMGNKPAIAADRGMSFTILHTNDIHSNLIGMGPASDYTPFTLNDDLTRGGFARLAALIAARRDARKDRGPVLILDGGDYSMGTAFGAAIRKTGAELHLLSAMGYDAVTFGNHEFDLGPDGLAASLDAATKAGRIPAVVASNTDFSNADPSLSELQRLECDRTRGCRRLGVKRSCVGRSGQVFEGGRIGGFAPRAVVARRRSDFSGADIAGVPR
jgi:5'-nucleotidase